MIYVAAAIVIATLVAMASGRVDPVLTLLVALIAAGLLRIATVGELFAGLSNPGVVTVAAMLVIAKGVVQTGIVTRATWALLSTTTTAKQVLRRLIPPLGVASALINTTPIVAMLIPAGRELEQSRNIPARSVLLPAAHATTLAGTTTMIGTSSNLLIAGIAHGAGVDIDMLSYAPVAVPVALVGWLIIYLTAPRMLRGHMSVEAPAREWRVEIPVAASALARNRRAASMGISATQEYELTGIERWGELLAPDTPIAEDDVLVFAASEDGVGALWRSPLFGLPPQRLFGVTVKAGESGTLYDFEHDGSIRVVAARTDRPFRDTELIPGDTCYVAGDNAAAVDGSDGVGLWQVAGSRAPQPGKTWIALGILAAVVVAASFGLAPVELVASAGAVLMVLTGVLRPRPAARALDLRLLFILAGSIGLGTIVVESGLADALAEGIREASGGNVVLVIIVLALTTAAMTNLVTNAATASILTPVGIGLASELGIDPVTILALIGTCVSFTLINPFSHQSNLMVMRPGGYTTATFARFGVPLLAGVLVTVCAVAYVLVET